MTTKISQAQAKELLRHLRLVTNDLDDELASLDCLSEYGELCSVENEEHPYTPEELEAGGNWKAEELETCSTCSHQQDVADASEFLKQFDEIA
jgi:hypothetical protein